MKVCLQIALLAGLSAALLSADATYTQVTKFTGGTAVDMAKKMANMPMIGRMGGGAMKNAFEDQHYDVYVKGNKMARLGGMISTIYDLDAGTVTTINNTKQTYTTMTFDEMREQIEQMQQRMNRRRGGSGDLQFDVKVEKTGQTRTIDGQSAKETLITLTAKGGDGQSANGQMVVKTHAWLVPLSAATRELADFTRRLGEKFAYAYGSSPMMGAAAGGLGAAMKEAFSQDGYPVETDVEVTGLTAPMGGGDPSAPFMQMETLSSNFATGAVDAAKFTVPAEYKEEKRRH
jgi:TolA-binding protein